MDYGNHKQEIKKSLLQSQDNPIMNELFHVAHL